MIELYVSPPNLSRRKTQPDYDTIKAMKDLGKSQKINRLKTTAWTSWRLMKLLWQIDKWLLMFNALAVTTPAIIPFIYAYIFKLLIDQVILITAGTVTNYSNLFLILGAGFVVLTIQSLAFSAQSYATRLLYTKVPIALYQIVLNKISSLDMEYFEDSTFRNKLEKVKDAYTWRPLNMMENVLFAFQGVIQVTAAVLILADLSLIVVFIVLVVAIPELISKVKESELSWGVWDMQTEDRKRFWYVADLLQSRDAIKELKLFQLPELFLSQLKKIQQKHYSENKILATKYFGINSLFGVFGGVTSIGVMLYIVLQAIQKKLTIGDISYYSVVVTNLQQGIGGLFQNMVKLFSESLYVSSIFEVLDAPSKILNPEKYETVDLTHPPLIEFKNVGFKYAGNDKYALRNFNLTIQPGEKIALVGENGSGKTTLIKLLCRFYDVSEGEILINGVNLKNIDLVSWYKTLGVIFQDFMRYEFLAKDNIYFGKAHEAEDLDKIIVAAVSSGADPVIRKLQHGYDQMFGRTFENGIELSTGQWQKVALGRGFFRNAPVLILDEPTAAIDAKAEAEIFNKVEKLSRDKTVFIISHRFSTVRNADKIFVIDNGKIKESGSHEELMKESGQYAKLFKLQAKGYQ